MESSSAPQSTLKRLMRDLQQITREPLGSVCALPVKESNLFLWHGNLRPSSGPYAGCIFHISIEIPHNYPKSPPKIGLYTPIEHPNVFSWGGAFPYICLDMLKERSGYTPSYSGWTTAYTLQSILLQLQAFLFDENVPQEYGGSRSAITAGSSVLQGRKRAQTFCCPVCSHTADSPWPAFSQDAPQPVISLGFSPNPAFGRPSFLPSEASLAPLSKDSSAVVRVSPLSYRFKPTGRTAWRTLVASDGVYIPTRDECSAGHPKESLYWEAKVVHGSSGIARFGFATSKMLFTDLGENKWGFGYGGTAKQVWCGQFNAFGEGFGLGDTIGLWLDAHTGRVAAFKEGRYLGLLFRGFEAESAENLRGTVLSPTISFRDTQVTATFAQNECSLPDCVLRAIEAAAASSSTSEQAAATSGPVSTTTTPESSVVAWPADCTGPKLVDVEDHLLVNIMSFLPDTDIFTLMRTCVCLNRTARHHSVLTKRSLVCFYSKARHDEAILGVGLQVKTYPRSAVIDTLLSPMDLLSYQSFYGEHVDTSVWNERFSQFLPLALYPKHFEKSLDLIKHQIACVHEYPNAEPLPLPAAGRATTPSDRDRPAPKFSPLQALTILGKLMNSTVVQLVTDVEKKPQPTAYSYFYDSDDDLMSGGGGGGKGQREDITRKHPSENALLGYCAFHHLLLSLADKIPELVQIANRRVSDFISNSSKRGKDVVPNLGEFLVCLTISDIPWSRVAIPFLEENFCRNVRWYLMPEKSPELAFMECETVSDYRLSTVWEHTKVSTRLVMFQIHFLSTIGRPEGRHWRDILQHYNQTCGQPSEAMKESLQKSCMDLFTKVDCWIDFFERCRLPVHLFPNPVQLTTILKNSVTQSLQKQYHRMPHGTPKKFFNPPTPTLKSFFGERPHVMPRPAPKAVAPAPAQPAPAVPMSVDSAPNPVAALPLDKMAIDTKPSTASTSASPAPIVFGDFSEGEVHQAISDLAPAAAPQEKGSKKRRQPDPTPPLVSTQPTAVTAPAAPRSAWAAPAPASVRAVARVPPADPPAPQPRTETQRRGQDDDGRQSARGGAAGDRSDRYRNRDRDDRISGDWRAQRRY